MKTLLTLIALAACLAVACRDGVTPAPNSAADAHDTASGKPTDLAQVELALSTKCTIVTSFPDGAYSAQCSNGCFVKWHPLMKKPYVTCPKPQAQPWSPPCANPHRKGDGNPAGEPGGVHCWAPPDSWCADLSGQLETIACDNTGQCCWFPDTCTPCGWTHCLGSSDPACVAAVGGKLSCPDDLAKTIRTCAICNGVVVCP